MQSRSTIPGILAGLLAAAIWGGMYVVSKVVLEAIPPFGLLSLRLILGAGSLGLWWLWQRRAVPGASGDPSGFTRPVVLRILLIGALGYGISLGLQFLGTKWSTASNGALVTSATPAFVFVVAALFYHERLGWRRVAALALALVGVLAVIDPRGLDLAPTRFAGNLCLVGAALTWAAYSVFIGRAGRELPLVPVTILALLGGLPITLGGAAWELTQGPWAPLSLGLIAGVLFLGIISTAVAMAAWNYAFARLPASTASLTFFAQPLVGTLLAWLFLGEALAPLLLVGAACLLGALFLASRD